MDRLKRINPLHERFGYLGVVVLGIVVLLIGLLLRSDIFLTVVGVVLEILGWVGILGGTTTVIAGIGAFGHERGWWDRIIEANSRSGAKLPLARGLSGSALFLLVILFFFLPWMSVSCFDEELLTVSGTDIMGITQIDDVPSEIAGDDYGIGDALGSEAALLYVAVLLAVAGGVLFFLPGRQGNYVRAGLAGAGIVCLLAFVLLSLFSVASELGVGIGELEDAGIGISWKVGFWLSLLAYIAAIAIQFVPLPFADEPAEDG